MEEGRKERSNHTGRIRAGAAPRSSAFRGRRSGLGKVLALFRHRRLAGVARRRKLAAATLKRHELSVVACDLRSFTAFLEAAGPENVIALLRDYYAVVAEEALRFGGSIKDHAGDGMLVLVGADVPSHDHAGRALQLALSIRWRVGTALSRWRGSAGELGLGMGVTSGQVTVGTIEAASRLESVAVGTAVNLAARLCARANAGEILIDERTVELAGHERAAALEPLESVRLKGFSLAVRVFAAPQSELQAPIPDASVVRPERNR